MNILFTILLIVAGIVVLMLVLALFMNKDYTVKCSVVIDVANQPVFDYLKHLKNQDHFNKWVMMDPDMKKEFTGTDGTVGFIYKWNGNKKAGEGEQEIKSINEGKNMATEIRFVRPFPSVAYANLSTEALSDKQTKVTWSNTGKMGYPMNVMLSMVQKMLGKDMDESLAMLKTKLEK